MVTWALPLVSPERRDLSSLASCAEDLLKLTYKFNSDVIHAAVESLATLSRLGCIDGGAKPPTSWAASGANPGAPPSPSGGAVEPLLKLGRLFYRSLRQRLPRHKLEPKDLSTILRGLVVIGAVCRFKQHPAGTPVPALSLAAAGSAVVDAGSLPETVDDCNLIEACYALLVGYLGRGSAEKEQGQDTCQVATNALRGLCAMLMGTPRLMLNADQVLVGPVGW